MKQHRRKMVSEINLTPLLDVLFSILFIVMMTGMQNQRGMKEEHQQQVSQMEQEIFKLKEQVTICEKQMSSYDKYQTEAIIMTVSNIVQRENHYLIIKKGMEQKEVENIQMGVDKTQNTKVRIYDAISEIVEDIDNYPVYIVFYCDKKNIYTTEHRAIVEAFGDLQEKHKEVFFKEEKQ